MLSRRSFLAATGATVAAGPVIRTLRADEPKEKVKVALIGVGAQGKFTQGGIKNEEVVALCDLDENREGVPEGRKLFPKAEFFTDYRKLFDKVGKSLDAVAVCTPDHHHALPTMLALNLGKHVYCEKPLCHDVGEVRAVQKLAAEKKAITQMGTQIHAGDNYRRVVEAVQSGALGKVSRVHVWCSRRPDGGRLIRPPQEKPKLDLDLWRGPVADDFFFAGHKDWPHFHWRWWWPYGGGVLADMGCHFMDLAFWALALGSPTKVTATGDGIPNADNTVPSTLRVDYTFPATKTRGEVLLSWYHGVAGPDLDGKLTYKDFRDGVLFEGEGGKKLVSDYNKHQLFPDEFAKDFKRPVPTIAKSVGHHKEWLDAIRGTGKPLCHFGYAAPLTEAVLLGNVAYRSGLELAWDAVKGQTDKKEANEFLSRQPRKGWEYPG
jgi:predicted dehydrogenase